MDTNQSAASFKSSATKSGLTPLQLSEFHNFSYIMILCQRLKNVDVNMVRYKENIMV